jgi:hypothetical protein
MSKSTSGREVPFTRNSENHVNKDVLLSSKVMFSSYVSCLTEDILYWMLVESAVVVPQDHERQYRIFLMAIHYVIGGGTQSIEDLKASLEYTT